MKRKDVTGLIFFTLSQSAIFNIHYQHTCEKWQQQLANLDAHVVAKKKLL
jgi:hypothetical protein